MLTKNGRWLVKFVKVQGQYCIKYFSRKERKLDRSEYYYLKTDGVNVTYYDICACRTWHLTGECTEPVYSLTDWTPEPVYFDIGWLSPVVVKMPEVPPCCLTCEYGDQGNHGDELTYCTLLDSDSVESKYKSHIICAAYKRRRSL